MNSTDGLSLERQFFEATQLQKQCIRKALAIQKSLARKNIIDQLPEQTGEAFGIDPMEVLRGSREGFVMAARKTFCWTATKLGWGASELSRKFGIERTTITHHHDTLPKVISGWSDVEKIAFLRVVYKYFGI